MFPGNVSKVMAMIRPEDRVVDIGGWFKPFVRADYVVDFMPHSSRGLGGKIGDGKERFSAQTWVQMDLCDRKGLPFEDKAFDFSVCSHVLEDIRDPVFLCSEIIRISKRGYIEVPSRLVELCLGVQSKRYCGYHHHRWLVSVSDRKLTFIHKSALPLTNWKLRLPVRRARRLLGEKAVSWLFWEGSFEYEEHLFIAFGEAAGYFRELVRGENAYPKWMYSVNDALGGAKRKARTWAHRIRSEPTGPGHGDQ